jgi:hypothetical protein
VLSRNLSPVSRPSSSTAPLPGGVNVQHNGDRQKKLFCRCVLISIVDLLPHVQIVVSSSVELERYSLDPMEHQVRSLTNTHTRQSASTQPSIPHHPMAPIRSSGLTYGHIRNVGQGPARLLRNSWNGIVKDFKANDNDDVYRPRA